METLDLSLLTGISSDQVFQEFLHLCVDEICSRRGPSYDAFKTSSNWTEAQFSAAVTTVHKIVSITVKTEWNNDKIVQYLSGLPSNHQKLMLECLEIRREDIEHILQQEQCRISGPALEDFDWKLKWVMGSSSLSNIREPLLEVDLHLSERQGDLGKTKLSVASLELDHTELKVFLSALEKAQESLRT